MSQELDNAVAEYLAAKSDEEAATERRYAAERKISELLGAPEGGEGTVSAEVTGAKVSASYGMSRTINAEKWLEIAPTIDPSISQHLIKWKPSLVMKGFRYVEENRPELLPVLSKAIQSKPRKVSITVKPKES